MRSVDKSSFRPTPNLRARRRRTLVKVELHNSRNELQDIMVQDVSFTGLRATARNTPPQPDEMVTVRMPDSQVLWGLVRWVDGNQFGVEFDVSSSPANAADADSVAANGSQIEYKG
ncbi:MAG: PilZ domain-containing protein [Novosphingobium sp.]|nr:PilZ domain-containing protein [Novosphingobium sp.]